MTQKPVECKKDHSKYVLAKDLTVEHLPESYREPVIFDLIKSISGLTVRITVKYSSLQRQKYWQDTEYEYPGYSTRGSSKMHFIGSGKICDVFLNNDEEMTCPCQTCKDSRTNSSKRRKVWTIWVFTAAHIVYNSVEAKSSFCKLFYDTVNGGSKSFYGVRKHWCNITGDLFILTCVTCDEDLYNFLLSRIKGFNFLWHTVRNNYIKDKKLEEKDRKYKDRLVIIVSHPHGGPKSVSFGKLLSKEKKKVQKETGYRINYDTSTCPGSSGAPVYLFGQDWWETEFIHSGSNSEFNHSSIWSKGTLNAPSIVPCSTLIPSLCAYSKIVGSLMIGGWALWIYKNYIMN